MFGTMSGGIVRVEAKLLGSYAATLCMKIGENTCVAGRERACLQQETAELACSCSQLFQILAGFEIFYIPRGLLLC